MPHRIAFLTGGTGFVGSHLAEELLARGYDEVRCLVRSRLKWLEGVADEDAFTPVRATLSDLEALWNALDGVTHVYHLGGVTRAQDWHTFQENNVRATLSLLGAVKQAAPGVERVLVTSSLAAVGRCDEDVADESTPLRPVSRYGKSKAQMEEALAERHDMRESFHDQLPITVVRPPAVYGPRDRDILDFFKAVSKGICPVVGGGIGRLSLVFARDLARGMAEAAEAESAAGETYFLGGRERAYTWNEVKAAATAALGRRALTVPVPGPLVGAVGAASEAWGKLTGSYPPLNREKAREIRHACKVCSSAKARADFGYAPATSLKEGVAKTIDWYRENDWL